MLCCSGERYRAIMALLFSFSEKISLDISCELFAQLYLGILSGVLRYRKMQIIKEWALNADN